MPVKPLYQAPNESKKIEEFINKGGKVSADEKEDKDEWTMISVRIPKSLLKQIDEKRSQFIGITRNTWILQLFQKELLEKD